MTPPHPAANVVVWFFLFVLLFITSWDAIVIALQLPYATVSYSVYYWSQQYPLLYLLYGVVIGHLIVPLTVAIAQKNGQLPPQ